MLVMVLAFGMTVTGCDIEDDSKSDIEITWNGHRYKRISQSKTWNEAKSYCESLGGYLATIISAEEQAAVYNLIADGDKNVYWIGGYLTGDGWVWVTGEQWMYTNWALGEPNDQGGNESCTQMYRKNNYDGTNSAGKWNDIVRTGWDDTTGFFSLKNTGFICEWD